MGFRENPKTGSQTIIIHVLFGLEIPIAILLLKPIEDVWFGGTRSRPARGQALGRRRESWGNPGQALGRRRSAAYCSLLLVYNEGIPVDLFFAQSFFCPGKKATHFLEIPGKIP